MNVPELIAQLRLHYPAGRTWNDHSHDYATSAEVRRFHERWEQALTGIDKWADCRRRIGEEVGAPFGDATAYRMDPGFRCAVYVRDIDERSSGVARLILPCVSVLAPVYYVYAADVPYRDGKRQGEARLYLVDLPPDVTSQAARARQVLQATYGYEPLPPELVAHPLPNLCLDHAHFDQATLFEALFTWAPANLP